MSIQIRDPSEGRIYIAYDYLFKPFREGVRFVKGKELGLSAIDGEGYCGDRYQS